MADIHAKHIENVPGAFFTDDQCIFCQLCAETAPAVFKMTPDDDHAYVYRQPSTAEEADLAREALEGCPAEAIGEVEPAACSPA